MARRVRRSRLTDSLTLRGRSFLAAGLALVACGVVIGFPDITRLGVLVAGLPLLVLLVASRQQLAFATAREVHPAVVPMDQWCDVHLRLRNPGPGRTPILMAQEQVDYALGDRPRFVIPRMAPDAEHQVSYRVRSSVRGRHQLGPLGLRIKDPFEMTLRLAAVPGTGEVIVLPRLVDLSGGALTGGLGNDGTIPHLIALHGEDDVSVREYRDGDDLRHIHWPATARTGELMVRQEDRPATRRIVILLDDRASSGHEQRSASAFEWAVTAAASIANLVIDGGTHTHLILAGEAHAGFGGEQLRPERALTALAVAELHDPATFSASVRLAGDAAGAGSTCIAVLAAMDDAEIDAVARIRPPGSPGLAFVTPIAEDGRGPDPHACAARLRERGWSAVVVEVGTSVAAAWSQARAGSMSATR